MSDYLPVTYSADEIGERLGKSGRWVRDQALIGRIGSIRVGRQRRYLAEHLEAYLERVKAEAARQTVVIPTPSISGLSPRSRVLARNRAS